MSTPLHPRDSESAWINAVIELTIPLDGVTMASSSAEKQAAVVLVLSRVIEAVPEDVGQYVGSAHWEEAGEERQTDAEYDERDGHA